MVETYRTTSKINKQQSVKGSKNCNTSSRIKRQIITDRKTHTHKHTQNEQPYLQSGIAKLQR